ncbi:MAG: hypothetical protein C0412_15530 [Flavobacterium sp.]|nr:hypothetical protein [Flavobacterium sp.]
MNNQTNNLMRDLGIIAMGIILAIILAKTEILQNLIIDMKEWGFLSSLFAGVFFVSIFTTAPATVALIKITEINSIWEVALFGGIGALIGDFLIFRFIKNNVTENIQLFIKKARKEKLTAIFNLKLFKWLIPFIGALIIASPLPDELGLAMMGFAKMKTTTFIPLSFTLNFFGILIILLIAKKIF